MTTEFNQLWYVQMETFYDYVKSGKFPTSLLRSVVGNYGGKPNYKTHWMPLPEAPKGGAE